MSAPAFVCLNGLLAIYQMECKDSLEGIALSQVGRIFVSNRSSSYSAHVFSLAHALKIGYREVEMPLQNAALMTERQVGMRERQVIANFFKHDNSGPS
jgi:hypothetical protein